MRRAAGNFLRGVRRRSLEKVACEFGDKRIHFLPRKLRRLVGTRGLAVGVVRVCGVTEAHGARIALPAAGIKARESRGPAEQQHQDARSQGVERAQVADLPESQQPANHFDCIVRGSAPGFLDDEGAVNRRRLGLAWHGRAASGRV
jgi:hypothetical protein